MRRLVIAGLSVAVMAASIASAADAAYPGKNGKIALNYGSDIWAVTPPDAEPVVYGSYCCSAWSPDGQKLAVASTVGGNTDIWSVNPDGTGLTRLTDDPGTDTSPTWSPDGTRIAFASNRGASHRELWVMNADGSSEVGLTNDPTASSSHPAWSPDGSLIAFIRNEAVYTIAPDGTGLTLLNGASLAATSVDWSPDGQELVLSSGEFDARLLKINRDGSGPTTLLSNGNENVSPSWSPAGDAIWFSSRACDFFGHYWDCADYNLYKISPDGTGLEAVDSDIGTSFDDIDPSVQPIPINAYPRPKGATPVRASLVPAFAQCTAPDETHGPPLAFPSCGGGGPHPATSGYVTIGTPDANGAPANSAGALRLDTVLGDPGTPADEADVQIIVAMTDIRCFPASTIPTCGAANAQAGPDYIGELQGRLGTRITDKDNTPHPGGPGPATVEDIGWSFVVPCSGTPALTVGGHCSLITSGDALMPGSVKEGARATWEIGQIEVLDGGSDGDADTSGNTLFANQGIFIP